jgi:hypothetical protein
MRIPGNRRCSPCARINTLGNRGISLFLLFWEAPLKIASNLVSMTALALCAGIAAASVPALADVAAETDVTGKELYVKPGQWLRYSDAIVSRPYTVVKVTLLIKGRGVCTKRLCPVTHNNVDLWVLRSAIDVKKPEDVKVVTERTLREGDEGTDVKLAQEALIKSGAKIEADGKFGRSTTKAVSQFQEKNGLDTDGDIGPATRDKLKI